MKRTLLCLAVLALAACGSDPTEGGTSELKSGVAQLLTKSGWVPAAVGPLEFVTGTSVEASPEGATIETSVGGRARATLTLGPGARVKRRAGNAFDLVVGTVQVETSGLTDRVLLYRDGCYVEAGRATPGDVAFTATVVGKQLSVLAETGTLQLNAIGETPMDLNYATIGVGEQGIAAQKTKPLKRHMDDSVGPYLTPRLTLKAQPGAAGAPLSVEVVIAAGETGAFHGLPVATEGPDSLVLLATGPGGDATIALRPTHVRKGETVPSSVLARSDVPFDVSFDVADHGLAAGTWKLRARYLSYGEHAEGPEWIGAVESAPVTVTLSE